MLDVSRQVLPVIEVKLKEQGKLGAIAMANRKGEATTTRVEWKEMSMGAVKVQLTSGTVKDYFNDNTPKEIEVVTESLLVGDILSLQDKNKKSKGDLRIMITEIVSPTRAKAQKIGGVNVAIELTDFLYVETTANEEGSITKRRKGIMTPRTLFNYTQIIKENAIMPGTQVALLNYDFKDVKAELRKQVYKKFADKFDGLVTSTVRTIVSTPDGDKRVAGGLLYFANNTFNKATGEYEAPATDNILEVNGKLTIEQIDLAFKNVIENDGSIDSVVVNTAQAIAISKLYQDKVNVNVINGTAPNTVGGAVQILKSPINVAGNEIRNIYLDTKMPQDEAIFFNKDMFIAMPLQGRAFLEKINEPNGDNDNYSIDVLGEWTIIYQNARENTFILKKLDV